MICRNRIRAVLRWLIAVAYLAAAYLHIANPAPFKGILPGFVPWPGPVIFWTGVAEGLGAIALVQQWSAPLRRAGAIGLALYAVCVFPANINHFALDMARTNGGGLPLAYHVPRMFLQPVLVWLALWTGGVTNWPFANRRPS